jgi:hypothetical protein
MGLLWQTVDAYCQGDPHAGRLLGELKDHLRPRGHLAVGFVVSAVIGEHLHQTVCTGVRCSYWPG